MAAALPRRLFMTSGPAASRSVALTFDDGPDPRHTPEVLDQLRALGVRATFFVIGGRAEAHPQLVRRIAAEGHEVGHHSYAHTPPAETSARALVAEARRTSALLARLLGKPPRLYRPPHGKLTPAKLLGLWALGQTVVLWNRDPKDFACGAVEPIRRWFETAPLAGGDILLLHDVHPHVAPALGAVVQRAARLGLGFGTPTDWRHG
jgi:peptidoglycan/xylan/chitin deacetylase (PgdA/CDA1 family)